MEVLKMFKEVLRKSFLTQSFAEHAQSTAEV
jgi:hypothetical protein